LGKPIRSPGTPFRYTLHPVYEYIMVDLLKLVDIKEGITATLSLDVLENLVSKAARNGVGMCTQSPFKSYYAGLLRNSNYGGRDSETHQRNMEQLMTALGIKNLYRGMDRDIDTLVAPEVTALFLLTSQCNHSCQPNAELQSQQFADAHIDLVALEDIRMGEEVCISYIGRRRNKFQRKKELRGRYLFDCHCERCIIESS
jgi:hypothetical protein